MSETTGEPTRERLLASAAKLMADKGFNGASVREICAAADTSSNMVHHYFGSKQGLLQAIVEQFSSGVFDTPMRIIEREANSHEDFVARMELLFETTLDAYIEHREVFLVVLREQANPPALPLFMSRFAGFLEQAKHRGFVRPEVVPEMISGFLLDRILNQVQLEPWIKHNYGIDLRNDTEYKRQWCQSNIDIFLRGVTNKQRAEPAQ